MSVPVTFRDHRGGERVAEVEAGSSLMEGALANGIAGILADCGGALSCATCHVHVDPAWMAAIPPPSEDEEALLELAIDPDDYSRLSCQIRVEPALAGLIVTLPPRQV